MSTFTFLLYAVDENMHFANDVTSDCTQQVFTTVWNQFSQITNCISLEILHLGSRGKVYMLNWICTENSNSNNFSNDICDVINMSISYNIEYISFSIQILNMMSYFKPHIWSGGKIMRDLFFWISNFRKKTLSSEIFS